MTRALALDGGLGTRPDPGAEDARAYVNGRYVEHYYVDPSGMCSFWVRWPGSKGHVGDALPAHGDRLALTWLPPRLGQRATTVAVQVSEASEHRFRDGVMLRVKGHVL